MLLSVRACGGAGSLKARGSYLSTRPSWVPDTTPNSVAGRDPGMLYSSVLSRNLEFIPMFLLVVG